MKTIIRVGTVVDSPDRFAEEKMPPLASRLLAEAYAQKRGERPEALLLLDKGKDGEAVYITVAGSPPELCVGGRRVWAVFSPPESQEPIATFFDQHAARNWATGLLPAPVRLNEVDSTDAPRVQTVVAVVLLRGGKTLLGRLRTGVWTLPEGILEVGETLDSAAQRIMVRSTGISITQVAISRSVPYVNTYFERTGQHFLTLVMLATDPGGEPQIIDKQWEEWGFFSSEETPSPLLVTVQQMISLSRRFHEPPPPALPPATPTVSPIRAASARSRDKRPPQRRSRSR